MSQRTKIEWCDSTINPTSGCDGCEILETCYARPVHENRLAHSFPDKYAESFLDVREIPGRMRQAARWSDLTGKDRPGKPWLNGLPRLVFISDMSDALSKAVGFEFLHEEIIKVVREWKHIGLWLTKLPARMAEFDLWLAERGEDWPVNLWAGTSITSQAKADKRILPLMDMRAKVRFLSCEPLLGPVDLYRAVFTDPDEPEADRYKGWPEGRGVLRPGVDWVIAGGESGYKRMAGDRSIRPMHPDWVRGLRDQCCAAGVPFFFKQWGSWVPHPDKPIRNTNQGADLILLPNGNLGCQGDWWEGRGQAILQLGKKAAGATLDGREWREVPRP